LRHRKRGNMSETEQVGVPNAKPKGKPFQKGNPGKPRGARNHSTVALEALLDGQGKAIVEKVVEAALAGNPLALKLCFERLMGARRDRPVELDLPPIKSVSDCATFMSRIVEATASGKATPQEAAYLSTVASRALAAYEMLDLAERVRRLEETQRGAK